MDGETIWTLTFAVLLTAFVWPLLKKKPALVPIYAPMAYLMIEVVALGWMWQGGWTGAGKLSAMLCFFFIGLVLIMQYYGRRRWYIFRAGGFRRDVETYDALALAIRQAMQEARLMPAAVIFRYDGWLGLSPMAPAQEEAIFSHIDEALEDTRYAKRGAWHLFFGVQWLVMLGALFVQFLQFRGGF